jgi:hypothetical protein
LARVNAPWPQADSRECGIDGSLARLANGWRSAIGAGAHVLMSVAIVAMF